MKTDSEQAFQRNKQKHLSKNVILQKLLCKFNFDVTSIVSSCHPEQVLDVGCGEGFTTCAYALSIPSSHIIALDNNIKVVQYARRYNRQPNIKYVIGDLFNLDFPNDSFDLVVCNEVIEHLHNFTLALKILTDINSNYLLLSVPNEPWFQLGNILRLKYLANLGNHPEHVNRWTKEEIIKLVSRYSTIIRFKTSTFWNIILLKNKR